MNSELRRLCHEPDTLKEAQRLLSLASARTGPGSGYDLGTMRSSLAAICVYLASNKLNNNEMTLESAKSAACLSPKEFKKAFGIINTVLQEELKTRKGKGKETSYDILHERYAVRMPYSRFSTFVLRAEESLLQLGASHKDEDTKCALFWWICSIIEVEHFPTIEEYAQENALMAKRLSPIIKTLNDKCKTLKTKITEASKNPTSRPGSPIKLATSNPQTPRRSPRKPIRELPSRDSAKKKQQQAQAAPEYLPSLTESQDEDVGMMELPETPTKKRKIEITTLTPVKKAATTLTPRQIFPPPHTSTLPRVQVRNNIPTSPSKSTVKTTLPSNPSPLRRSARNMLQDEVDNDDSMEADEDEVLDISPRKLDLDPKPTYKNSQLDGMEEEMEDVALVVTRRYKPVYQDWKQWCMRDARVVRIYKEAQTLIKRNSVSDLV